MGPPSPVGRDPSRSSLTPACHQEYEWTFLYQAYKASLEYPDFKPKGSPTDYVYSIPWCNIQGNVCPQVTHAMPFCSGIARLTVLLARSLWTWMRGTIRGRRPSMRLCYTTTVTHPSFSVLTTTSIRLTLNSHLLPPAQISRTVGAPFPPLDLICAALLPTQCVTLLSFSAVLTVRTLADMQETGIMASTGVLMKPSCGLIPSGKHAQDDQFVRAPLPHPQEWVCIVSMLDSCACPRLALATASGPSEHLHDVYPSC